ncbi:MAG: hypothetical protein ACTSV6_08170, partial [Candidatus Heimdallarchaeota archaeon]
FKVVSNEIEEVGEITLEVVSPIVVEEEDIQQKILNYEFLISQIEQEIISASNKGFDVTLANQSLNNAKSSLELAKSYLEAKKIEDAKKELANVERSLEDAALQLASATMYVYRPPAVAPFLMLSVILGIAIVFLIFYYYKKKKKKRPKLLRELETEK